MSEPSARIEQPEVDPASAAAAAPGGAAPASAERVTSDLTDGPLQGLRAIEFGQPLAGPYVGTLLGDFGADVIKVEPPPAGDAMREWGRLRHNDHSLWWSILARNKRSITLNLRVQAGQRIARTLAQEADVVLENCRPGTMERWGLGPVDLLALNRKLIYARVTGYGQTGRYKARPGFASAGEAISACATSTAIRTRRRLDTAFSIGDTLAAQSAFTGILLALYARDARGVGGQVVDASITDACFAVTESAVLENEKTGIVRQPTGPRLPRIAPSSVYRSKDGRWVVIAANHDSPWRRLAVLIGRPELADDPRFSSHRARGENEDLLDELIGEWAEQHTAVELDRIVNEAGVVCAPVYTAADVYEDPYFREHGRLVEYQDTVHGKVTAPGVVPRLTSTPGRVRSPANWSAGGDTDAVLKDRGIEEDEVERLRGEGVV